jgi:hypothetical protein
MYLYVMRWMVPDISNNLGVFNLQMLGSPNLCFLLFKLHRWSHVTSRRTRNFRSLFKLLCPLIPLLVLLHYCHYPAVTIFSHLAGSSLSFSLAADFKWILPHTSCHPCSCAGWFVQGRIILKWIIKGLDGSL